MNNETGAWQLSSEARQLLDGMQAAPAEMITRLKAIINFADTKYYLESESVLTDQEYDALFRMLRELEEAHPDLVERDSPTQRVAAGLSEKFTQVNHLVPMLSLDNTYNAEDLRDWDRRCREYTDGAAPEYCVEPKYDGASISLVYEDGMLVRGATRGDGVTGEEITTNIRQIRSVPLSAAFRSAGLRQVEIRGEVVIHKEVFARFNEQRVREGLAPLANPRNAASGTLRMLNPEEVRKRKLSAVLYHVSDYTLEPGAVSPAPLQTHYDTLSWLYRLGFATPVEEMQKFGSIEEVIRFCTDFEERRDDLPYEVDGLVIKVNSLELQDRMGMTAHHPRWAVAYKFSARQAASRLARVEFQVGRTGTVTPVGKIDPVSVGGVTITSVSLFNEANIRDKDLRIGDRVLVERAGDVIPYIVRSMPELRDGTELPVQFPSVCPRCAQPLDRPEEEALWRCINISCPAQVVERIMHFCSKDAMDIRGMGESNVRKFFEQGILPDIPGLYSMDWERISVLEGFGSKSVANLKQAIEQSKAQPLHRLVFGLGIRHVGETTAKTLATSVNNLRDLYEWDEEKLIMLDDIGPKVAASVVHFFRTPENRHMIDLLEHAGVSLVNTHRSVTPGEGRWSGKTFLFTGTLTRFKRSEAEAMVEERGGSVLGGVSSKLNVLVVGADAGSKLEKAKKLGTVLILTEDEFLSELDRDGEVPDTGTSVSG